MRGEVAGLALGLALACGPAGYECSSDAACDGGYCEVTGYCSLEDPKCASGRRYVDLAGPYSGECVAQSGAVGTDSTGADGGDDGGSTAPSDADGMGGTTMATDSAADDDPTDTSTTSGAVDSAPTTQPPMTDEGGETTGTDEGSSSDGNMSTTTGPPPAGGPYHACTSDMECDGGFCESLFMGDPTQCLYLCMNDDQCPSPQMSDPTPTCLKGVCVLDCMDGSACPEGMTCMMDYYPMCVPSP